MNRIAFKQIAEESGLSVRTLYRAMNNSSEISAATRRKAVAALNRFGYLCAGQRNHETIVIDFPASAFQSHIATLLLNRLSGSDCNIVPADCGGKPEHFWDAMSHAAITVLFSHPSKAQLEKLRYANPECLLINILGGGGGDVAIDADDFRGGALAAGHLHENGHTDILIATPLSQPNHIDRVKGFEGEMRFLNPRARIEIAEYRGEPVELFWKNFFSARRTFPDAVFSPMGGIVDFLPYYAEKYAHLRVPEDLAVVGYNRPEERGTKAQFALDCIYFEPERIADCCKYYMIQRPLIAATGSIHTLIEPKLEIRGSVKPKSGEK